VILSWAISLSDWTELDKQQDQNETESNIFLRNLILDDIEKKISAFTVKACPSLKKWNLTQVEKSIKKARSLSFAIQYLNKHLNRDQIKRVFCSHFVSRLLYGCPVWGLSITYNQRAAIRSAYYCQIRVIVRDFDLKMNRNSLIKVFGVQSLDTLIFNRVSVFIFSILINQEPNDIFLPLLANSYYNERDQNRLVIFKGPASITCKHLIINIAHQVVNQWRLEWMTLNKLSFK